MCAGLDRKDTKILFSETLNEIQEKKHSTKIVALNRINRIHDQTEKCITKTK